MLTLRIQAFFASFGQTFRKGLVLDYKKGNKHTHRNTHAIPLKVKDRLLKVCVLKCSPKREAIGKELDKWKGRV